MRRRARSRRRRRRRLETRRLDRRLHKSAVTRVPDRHFESSHLKHAASGVYCVSLHLSAAAF